MKKRLLISEEEKKRILGLHKQLMFEQPVSDPQDYATNMAIDALSQPISTKKGVLNSPIANPTSKNEESNELKPGLYYFSVKGCGSCEKYSSSVWPEIENKLKNTNIDFKKIVFDDFVGGDIDKVRKELSKMGAKSPLIYFPQVIIINKDNIVIYESPAPPIEDLMPELEKSFGVKIEVKKQDEKKSEEKIVQNFDRKYNYKKDGDKYYFQLKSNPESWTEATGSAKIAIGYQVFKDKSLCQFPSGDPCLNYTGEKWDDNPEKNKVDFKKTKIGFCSTNYCSVKWIQYALNEIIKDENRVGHDKLRGLPELKVDGKFGTTNQNYIYKLLRKVNTTATEISNQLATK